MERLIRFLRESFFRARRFRDLDDLNDQVDQWCSTRAAERPCPEDPQRTVADVFAEERPHLIALPDNPFPCEERVEVQAGKSPYIRFDGNDYSIPHRYVARTLVVSASLDTVRILDAGTVLATHRRSFDRAGQVEDPAHIEELEREKRLAREHRATDRLHHAAPSSKALFVAAAERNHHLGVLARGLIALLNAYGPVALERAIAAALAIRCHAPRRRAPLHRPAPQGTPTSPRRSPSTCPTTRGCALSRCAPTTSPTTTACNDESDSGNEDAHRDDDNEQDTNE